MASYSALCPKSSSALALSGSPLQPQNQQQQQQQQQSKLSFPLSSSASSSKSKSSLICGSSSLDQATAFSRFQGPTRNKSTIWKVQAQLNDVAAEKPSNSIPVPEIKLDVPSLEAKDGDKTEDSSVQNGALDESSISEFMSQVSDLVKLVDSKDIVELKLKQLDCEIIIRKQEALPQAAAPPVMMMQQPPPQTMMPYQAPPAPANSPPASPAPAPKALPAPSKSSAPPLKSPMAGTFYRCSGPGEPPFVKVGDKVKKGQVVCIIEAMKLMNEIEADQSGTIVEILPEDGKPISFGAPILVIQK